jgi:uncharacterized protein YuzE
MLTISGINFDHHVYDERADVLYLSIGDPQVPEETVPTPEGHAVDFDADGNVIGMVLVSVRLLLDRDGQLTITWPEGHLAREQLAPVLAPAA